MAMTPEEVRELLGLVPWNAFRARSSQPAHTTVCGLRGTGRTWRMLVTAISCASEGKTVFIASHSMSYTKTLLQQVEQWMRAHKELLPFLRNIKSIERGSFDSRRRRVRGLDPDTHLVLQDHFWS